MKHFSHLNTAVHLVGQYRGEMPFSIFLRSFFSQHSKYGSKDRKRIAHLCYCYFRMGQVCGKFAVDDVMLAGLFLCNINRDILLDELRPSWADKTQLEVSDKLSIVNESLAFSVTDIFPWKDELSEGVNHLAYCRSMLIQPDLFIRIRPGNDSIVRRKLGAAGIAYREVTESCIALPNGTKIDQLLQLDQEAVVHDINSQATASYMQTEGNEVWDCCAASGGKSLLVHDRLPQIHLTVSDIRKTIIANLQKRFESAGIKNYQAFVADLTQPGASVPAGKKFDLIICDAPCTGSGTWSRTPEQLAFFEGPQKITHYGLLQRTILNNVIKQLKMGGRLVYITCSVFRHENEEAVADLLANSNLMLEKKEMLKGYDSRADTLFVSSCINR